MEKDYLSLCIICLEQFLPTSASSRRNNTFPEKIFVKFCKELEASQSIQSQITSGSTKRKRTLKVESPFHLDDLVESIKLHDNLTLCSSCQSFISSAVRSRDNMTQTEVRVRHMQLQILREMKQLETQVEEYYMEMKKVANGIIGTTDVPNFELHFGSRPRRTSSKSTQDNIVAFRDQIVKVMEELKWFRKQAFEKLHTKLVRPPKQSHKQSDKIQRELEFDLMPVKSEIIEEADYSLVETEESFPFSEQVFETEPSTNDRESETQSDCEYIPESDHSDQSEEEDKDDDAESEVSEEEFAQDLNNQKFSLSKMSPFKRNLVKRVLLKLKKHQEKLENPVGEIDYLLTDPRGNYLFKYDHDRGSLFAGNVEVTINENTESVKCTSCAHEEKVPNLHKKNIFKPEQRMHVHVLKRHLSAEVFKCPLCSKVFSGYERYHQHVQGHKNKFVCDICGKPLFSGKNMLAHKWTHLNAEEKAEAGRQGRVNLDQKRAERNKKGIFPCQTCGKIYSSQPMVRQHERIHRPNRERVVCAQCGKSVFKASWLNHQLYVCPTKELLESRQQHIFPCTICSKVFPTKKRYEIHLTAHSDERPYSCSICKKGFKTLSDVRRHETYHSSKRRYSCSKTCGATFKDTTSCRRHSKLCDGTGTPVRKRKVITKTHVLHVDEEGELSNSNHQDPC